MVELIYGLPLGTLVYWTTVSERHEGVLEEWDNGTAIVRTSDGKTKAVRCV
jgi:hypothetical protein